MAVLSGILSLFALGDGYTAAMRAYPSQGRALSLSDVLQERSSRTLNALMSGVEEAHAVVVRSDVLVSPVDGSVEGYRLGVYGDVGAHSDEAAFRYQGADVLDSDLLSRLLRSDADATLGLDRVSADMIASLPAARFGGRLVVVRLDTLERLSGTVNGDCRIISLDDMGFRALVQRVSEASGIDAQRLTSPLHGSSTGDSFMRLIALVLLAVASVALVLLSVRPVAAIHNRVSKKALLVVIAVVYVLASAGLVAGAHALDAPMNEVSSLGQVNARWSQYDSLRLLYKDSRGTNHTESSGTSGDHMREVYDWYTSIEGRDGVYVANTRHFDAGLLAQWKGLYKQVPEQAFWYFIASPNYLKDQGFDLDPDTVARAETGERMFLIPDTMDAAEQERMRGYLTETSMKYKDWASSIHTTFMDAGRMGFITYHPSTPLFTWSDDLSLPSETRTPVILVATGADMTPFEAESLGATGLTNSYIKLGETAARQYTTTEYLAEYRLEDNNPVYRPDSDFIAGLRKSLTEFIQLFGGIALLAALFQLIGMATLCRVYAVTYRETIAVKRLLGYSLTGIFAPAFIMVAVVSAISILATVLLGSTAGIIAAAVTFVFQLILLAVQSRALSSRQVQVMIKSE
ncbi:MULTISPECIES: hypothetical protein [unclassified Bifidobacterium]|uniref:hypothetical protein n=1 Tax=unclassified Bifidobacterium TaxID=2608897 RepID=UPI00112C1479|nr:MULTISPECIES: hypothetical protein [unclassified Bifidobacterium]